MFKIIDLIFKLSKDTSYTPKGMKVLNIPEAEYAVFAVPKAKSPQELHENVNKTWKYIFSHWLDNSGYKFDHSKIDFEYYIGEETYIYVPIIK
ncbi:GyrI-like domain-containing protein [Terrisporobacter petrolearius]|uniref:GyrI-like domain-containing protein n=1 Tax=Terrisporobacter petrolearius TaxID=1460447 RepID=UPI003B004146